jgi:hypothetical protein
MAASFVLVALRGSTYLKTYASPLCLLRPCRPPCVYETGRALVPISCSQSPRAEKRARSMAAVGPTRAPFWDKGAQNVRERTVEYSLSRRWISLTF